MIAKATLAGCLLILVCCLPAKAQLNANFGALPNSGCAPLFVQFHDSSTGNPTYWNWNLGNATTSFLPNPSVTYFDPGVYTVTLVVKNSTGQDSIIKTHYITVYASPTVLFTANKVTGCYPLVVKFTDHSAPGSGTSAQWR